MTDVAVPQSCPPLFRRQCSSIKRWARKTAPAWIVVVLAAVFAATTFLLNTPLAFGRYGVIAWLLVIVCGVALLLVGTLAIFYSEFHRAYTFWKPYPKELKFRKIVFGACVAWICLTAVFVEIGLLLFAIGLLHVPDGMRSYEVSGRLYGLFGWQLGASMPAVDASGTLDYGGPSFHDRGVAGLLLAYKALVVLPAASILAEIIRRSSKTASGDGAPVTD